jgi:hypothetical protein
MGFEAKKIQSWKKLENHMRQNTWVSKFKNLELNRVWKPYALAHMGFKAQKSKIE